MHKITQRPFINSSAYSSSGDSASSSNSSASSSSGDSDNSSYQEYGACKRLFRNFKPLYVPIAYSISDATESVPDERKCLSRRSCSSKRNNDALFNNPAGSVKSDRSDNPAGSVKSDRSDDSLLSDSWGRHGDFSSRLAGSFYSGESNADSFSGSSQLWSENVNTMQKAYHEQQGIDDRAHKEQRIQGWLQKIEDNKDDNIRADEDELNVSGEEQLRAMANQMKVQAKETEQLFAEVKRLLEEMKKKDAIIAGLHSQLKAQNEATRPATKANNVQPQTVAQKAGLSNMRNVDANTEGSHSAPYVFTGQPCGYVYPVYVPVLPVVSVYNMVPVSSMFTGYVQSYAYTSSVWPVMYYA